MENNSNSFLDFWKTPKSNVIFLKNNFLENIFQIIKFSAKQIEP